MTDHRVSRITSRLSLAASRGYERGAALQLIFPPIPHAELNVIRPEMREYFTEVDH